MGCTSSSARILAGGSEEETTAAILVRKNSYAVGGGEKDAPVAGAAANPMAPSPVSVLSKFNSKKKLKEKDQDDSIYTNLADLDDPDDDPKAPNNDYIPPTTGGNTEETEDDVEYIEEEDPLKNTGTTPDEKKGAEDLLQEYKIRLSHSGVGTKKNKSVNERLSFSSSRDNKMLSKNANGAGLKVRGGKLRDNFNPEDIGTKGTANGLPDDTLCNAPFLAMGPEGVRRLLQAENDAVAINSQNSLKKDYVKGLPKDRDERGGGFEEDDFNF